MKKKILGATFVVAMTAIVGYNTYVNQNKNEMPDLALANVEALAGPEGEGTPASHCYLKLKYSAEEGWKKFCDERTGDKIYPCITGDDHGYYSESAIDRCTNL